MTLPASPLELAAAVCEGRRRAIARMLSLAESGDPLALPALDLLYQRSGRAHVVGVTGVPGGGKSSLVARVAAECRRRGRSVGILAVDPSSPFSGGAILGDRIRMGEVSTDPGVFMRSMASRGALGGLAAGVFEAVDILDAGGFELILVETVGVGQDEVDIASAAHTTVVVSPPGLGDEVQASKAGLLEIADIHAVTKADRPQAERIFVELQELVQVDALLKGHGTPPRPVIRTSASSNQGVAELVDAIVAHHAAMAASGELARRQQAIRERRMLKAAERMVAEELAGLRHEGAGPLLEALAQRSLSPRAAARQLLARVAQAPAAAPATPATSAGDEGAGG